MALPLATAWWASLAIIGGAAVGAIVSYVLLVVVGPSRAARESGEPRRLRFAPTDKTNYPSWNPAAFLTAGAIVALVVGLAVGLSVD